jgi:hypothetical protein
LERGLHAWKHTGAYIAPSRFTKKEWNTTLKEYMANTTRVTREDWRTIKAAASALRSTCMMTANNDPDTSVLQQYRVQIYVPQPSA